MRLNTPMTPAEPGTPSAASAGRPAGPTPWYRQFWPWFVIALPASAVIAGLTTVWIAVTHQQEIGRAHV